VLQKLLPGLGREAEREQWVDGSPLVEVQWIDDPSTE
jgi:hypothetical protein